MAVGSATLGSSLLGCAAANRGRADTAGPPAGPASERPIAAAGPASERPIAPAGPASRYTPVICAAFVRRQGDYGMRWPGAIYDGAAALRDYRRQIQTTAGELRINLAMRDEPIYSAEQADHWLAEAGGRRPDGLLVVLLDRQQHAWPTAVRAAGSGIPTVVFAPIGAAFTTNTMPLADKTGVFICSTDDFSQVAYGMRMIAAAARLREMRYVVLQGEERREIEIKHFGTKLRYVPAAEFLDEYNRTPITDEIKDIADEYIQHATRMAGPARQDVVNGVKSYVVARTILQREEADGITMDCLGALGPSKVSLPCIAWSRMLDHGIPAACEADLRACITHALVQRLFDRPGFQQDPVPETSKGYLVGAHCSCATRLNGFAAPPEPYYLSHHHGRRDAVPRTIWRVGQRMTVVDVILSSRDDVRPTMIISAGTVAENIQVPPSGGCVVSVAVKLDNQTNLLAYPGFHQLFVYGDHRRQLEEYCRLFGIIPQVV